MSGDSLRYGSSAGEFQEANVIAKRCRMTAPSTSFGVVGALAAALTFGPWLVEQAEARKYSDEVKVACSGDYDRFCKRYKIHDSKLRSCMRANGKRLSRVCIEALVDAGEVSRRELRRYRRR